MCPVFHTTAVNYFYDNMPLSKEERGHDLLRISLPYMFNTWVFATQTLSTRNALQYRLYTICTDAAW